MKSPLAQNLRAALAEQDWTQERLAREMDMSNRAIAGWCLGETQPHWRTLVRLAEKLGRDPEWFYARHDDEVAAA
jgi:transcriptional regulator with XRE-family HTH domain